MERSANNRSPLHIVFIGLSITSSWGNGHATTYRGLVRELNKLGHTISFFERDVSWYATNRDLPNPDYCKTILYSSLGELQESYSNTIREADLVILGSYVPEGVAIGEWVIKTAKGIRAFYDIDTPVTLAKLERNDFEYLHPELIPKFDLYLSFTGGPTLNVLEKKFGSPMARALYCSVDPDQYYPEKAQIKWDLGYLGTYSIDRQPPLEKLMFEAAQKWHQGKFVVAGAQYPSETNWPKNVAYIPHIPPAEHRTFYCSQRCTLNITRSDMISSGYSPSVRLFEAAACGTPIVSDFWEGIHTFFESGTEILISDSAEKTLDILMNFSEEGLKHMGEMAREKVLHHHTAAHRALELENYCFQLISV